MTKVDEFQKFKDNNGPRLTQEFVATYGEGVFSTPTFSKDLEKFMEMKYLAEKPDTLFSSEEKEVGPFIEKETVQPGDVALVILDSISNTILGVVLNNTFFNIDAVHLTEDLLFDLIESRVITSQQAKKLKNGVTSIAMEEPGINIDTDMF